MASINNSMLYLLFLVTRYHLMFVNSCGSMICEYIIVCDLHKYYIALQAPLNGVCVHWYIFGLISRICGTSIDFYMFQCDFNIYNCTQELLIY